MTGVILANTGSPATPEPDDVERYLRAFLMDDRIRQMPKFIWKTVLRKVILPKRKFSSAERYKFIWTEEGSPLVANMCRLAEKIQRMFEDDEDADSIVVRSAMSYGSPSLPHVLSELREEGINRIVLLPLYPQSAYSPTMAVVDSFWRAQDAVGWHPDSTIIDNYHDNEGYIAAITRSIRSVGYDAAAGDRLILSFHAIPLADEAAGDTYRAQIAASVGCIAARLGVDPAVITVSFQSVFGPNPSRWTAPLTLDVLKGCRDGSFRVVLACPGFSVDCLETLYDVPHDMVPALEGEAAKPVALHASEDIQSTCHTSGRFVWVPTLNASDEHAAVLKAILDEHV